MADVLSDNLGNRSTGERGDRLLLRKIDSSLEKGEKKPGGCASENSFWRVGQKVIKKGNTKTNKKDGSTTMRGIFLPERADSKVSQNLQSGNWVTAKGHGWRGGRGKGG